MVLAWPAASSGALGRWWPSLVGVRRPGDGPDGPGDGPRAACRMTSGHLAQRTGQSLRGRKRAGPATRRWRAQRVRRRRPKGWTGRWWDQRGLGIGPPGILGLGIGSPGSPGLAVGIGLGTPGSPGLVDGTEFAGCDGRPPLLPLSANANGVAITRAASTPAALAATVFRRRLRARRSALLNGSCTVGASSANSERVERSRCSNGSVIAAAPAVPCSAGVGAAG